MLHLWELFMLIPLVRDTNFWNPYHITHIRRWVLIVPWNTGKFHAFEDNPLYIAGGPKKMVQLLFGYRFWANCVTKWNFSPHYNDHVITIKINFQIKIRKWQMFWKWESENSILYHEWYEITKVNVQCAHNQQLLERQPSNACTLRKCINVSELQLPDFWSANWW